MIIDKTGNIFDSKCEVLVNPVNCVGVMGAGLAKQFKKKYPKMFEYYKRICSQGFFALGDYIYWDGEGRKVLNIATKNHWRNSSSLSGIIKGLKNFVKSEYVKEGEIKSIAFPMLGCGFGGLREREVYNSMVEILSEIDIIVEIYR